MALSEFEIIVGGLASIPVVAGVFFLIEKTYGSRNYLRKPVKSSPAPKASAAKEKGETAVKSSSSNKATAKPKASVVVKKSSDQAPVTPSDQIKPIKAEQGKKD